jgi:hypothetical protein
MTPRTALATTLAVAALALAGCSSSSSSSSAPAPAFVDTASSPTCMDHQPRQPAADPGGGDTARNLALLRYYTARGAQDYCDGAGPNAADLAWMRGYVALGGDAARVSRWGQR